MKAAVPKGKGGEGGWSLCSLSGCCHFSYGFPWEQDQSVLGSFWNDDERGKDLGRVVAEGGDDVPKGLFVWVLLSIHCQ